MSRAAPPARRPLPRSARAAMVVAPMVALSVLLAACGGGDNGGGGGGGTGSVLHVLVVNHTQNDVTVTDSTGGPLSSGDPALVKTCTASVVDFPLSDQFTVSIDDKVVIDTAQLPAGVPNQGQSDAVTTIDVTDTGAKFDNVLVGQFIQKPAQLGICIT